MGVNLPAHLVVIKGTTRYVGDQEGPGETAGYKEYSQTEVRAGRHAARAFWRVVSTAAG